MKTSCRNCGFVNLTVGQRIGGRFVCAAAGAVFGARTMKNPAVALLCTLAGLAVGTYIDKQLSKHCPQCGAVLDSAGLFLT